MSADTPTVPMRIAARTVLACAYDVAHHFRELLERNPRRAHGGDKDVSRRHKLAFAEAEIGRLKQLVASVRVGELPADVVALVAAWALGETSARKQLADILTEDGRADVLRGDSSPAQVMADLCR